MKLRDKDLKKKYVRHELCGQPVFEDVLIL